MNALPRSMLRPLQPVFTAAAIAALAACTGLYSPTVSEVPPATARSTAAPAAPTIAGTSPAAASPAVSAPPLTPPAPPPIVPYDSALTSAATALLDAAAKAAGNERRVLLVDPLIDGASAMQSSATERMGARIVDLARNRYPQFEVLPFTRANLARNPVVLVGTHTVINNAAVKDGPLDAVRICLALADLSTGRIMAKGVARAQPSGFDATPLPYFRDAPAWLKDPQVEGYIRTCQGTKPGDAIDPSYLDAMQVAALVSTAIDNYGQRRYAQALADYRSAKGLPGGQQLRVLNGVYLTQLRLNQRDEAERAFGEIVEFGLSRKKLSMFFLFRPGSIELTSDPQLNTPYVMWVRQIASLSERGNACLEITGHASKGGPESLNERLSLLRAQYIRERIEGVAPTMSKRMIVNGVGSRQTIVGTGADNYSDAPDRRVQFTRIDC